MLLCDARRIARNGVTMVSGSRLSVCYSPESWALQRVVVRWDHEKRDFHEKLKIHNAEAGNCYQMHYRNGSEKGHRTPVGLLPSYSTSDLSKTKCRWTQSCKVAMAICVLILLAWGIAVPLYFLVGPGLFLHRAPGRFTPLAQAQVADSVRATINGTVLNAANGSMVLANQRYTNHLDNHFTAQYQALKLKVETLMSVVFGRLQDFNKASVMGFRPAAGRVRVSYVLIFHKNQAGVKELVHSTLLDYLAKHWSMLGTYQVDLSFVRILNIRNQCAIDNGGCSHLCFWSLLSGAFECRCPQDYQLLGDERTCFPSVIQKQTTTINPCGEGSFACRSSNCIPLSWLCDGVSDCLLGEDEAQQLCTSIKRGDTENSTQKGHKDSISPTYPSVMEAQRAVRSTPRTSREERNDTPSGTAAPVIWQIPSTTPIDFPIPSLAVDPESWASKAGFSLERPDRPNRFKYFG